MPQGPGEDCRAGEASVASDEGAIAKVGKAVAKVVTGLRKPEEEKDDGGCSEEEATVRTD